MVQKFSSEILRNYLIFIPTKKYLRFFTNASKVYSWKSKGFSEEVSIEDITTLDGKFAPTLIDYYYPLVKFNGHCLVSNTNSSLKTINLYICYTLY